ncbi:MAG: imidazoleglycerol-phosphate dehydratase HisB [Planctomycetota bacterium]|jgi:imidazoleglycerol-phosphate dehydratase|nr:imidazoleglycerol-phosphate dehydratase HisB [Planctomycetota bacterium]
MNKRKAEVSRETAETKISLSLDLDGSGKADIQTGVPFFDHMLTLLARHSLFDLRVEATGDIQVDAHHTVEDVGICLGQALSQAVGDKRGINRYGFFLIPMEETLARVVLDLSGRALVVWRVDLAAEKCGDFDTCLGQEFFRALSSNAGINIHVDLLAGGNPHHELEAVFKALGRALRQAVTSDPREKGIPSSKNVLA